MAKSRKVEESATPYVASKPALKSGPPVGQPGTRFANLGVVRKTNIKLMQIHHKVLQKLAQ